MNKNAEKRLRGHIIVNAMDKKYPNIRPSTNTLFLHLEIFKLMEEYNNIYIDYEKGSCETRSILEQRLKEIETQLTNYWIVKYESMEA